MATYGSGKKSAKPDNTAVRTALWRALHVQIDAMPHIIDDEIGLKLVDPTEGWQQRPDMKFTKRIRATIVARARFIEDLIVEQYKQGITQYIILGAGLDTFTQRRPEIASKLQVYEIDQAETQLWKRQRLAELGFTIPEYLHLISVNFENSSWWQPLIKAGFDISKPAVIACTGVSLYLTKEAINDTLLQVSKLKQGSKLAMTFYLKMEFIDEEDKALQEMSQKGAQEAGTPMISFFAPDEILALATKTGFKEVKIVSTKGLEQRYFRDRTDDLLPASGEVFLLATT
jgi:methyltransferase (TIGR00027 family)